MADDDDQDSGETAADDSVTPDAKPEPAKGEVSKTDVSAAEAVAAAKGSADEAPRMDLPKWNRSRVKRKAPKGEEQDAFQEGVRKAGKGAVRKAPLLIGAIVLAAGGLAAGIAWTRSSAKTEALHTELLATAAAYEARGVVAEPDPERGSRPTPTPQAADEQALEAQVTAALGDLATQAPESAPHRMSRLLAAGRAMRAADFPGAEAAYRAYLDAKGEPTLDFIAREGLALAIEAQGRHDDALSELQPLLEGDARGFFRDQALWHKGRIEQAKGDDEAALATFREYVEHFPLAESSFARDKVVERLSQLDPDFVPPPTEQPQGIGGIPGLQLPPR